MLGGQGVRKPPKLPSESVCPIATVPMMGKSCLEGPFESVGDPRVSLGWFVQLGSKHKRLSMPGLGPGAAAGLRLQMLLTGTPGPQSLMHLDPWPAPWASSSRSLAAMFWLRLLKGSTRTARRYGVNWRNFVFRRPSWRMTPLHMLHNWPRCSSMSPRG